MLSPKQVKAQTRCLLTHHSWTVYYNLLRNKSVPSLATWMAVLHTRSFSAPIKWHRIESKAFPDLSDTETLTHQSLCLWTLFLLVLHYLDFCFFSRVLQTLSLVICIVRFIVAWCLHQKPNQGLEMHLPAQQVAHPKAITLETSPSYSFLPFAAEK